MLGHERGLEYSYELSPSLENFVAAVQSLLRTHAGSTPSDQTPRSAPPDDAAPSARPVAPKPASRPYAARSAASAARRLAAA